MPNEVYHKAGQARFLVATANVLAKRDLNKKCQCLIIGAILWKRGICCDAEGL
jgi:hypothetical protein